jgi:hypothetical protein
MEFRPEPVASMRRGTIPLVVALLIIGVAAVVLTMGFTPSGASGPGLALAVGAADASSSPDASHRPGPNAGPGGMRGMANGWSGGPGMAGGRMGGGLGQVSITAIDGSRVSLQSATGWTRTIDVSSVTLRRAGSTISAADLKVGDHVALGETRGTTPGSFTLQSVTVVLDQAAGTVSKFDASTITVTGFGGRATTITTSSSTVYRRAGVKIGRGDIAVGARLTASGTSAGAGSLAAEAVDVQPDVVFGSVTKKSGSALTIKTAGGGTVTVTVTSTTTYRVAGKGTSTIADIAVNDKVMAEGVLGADGTLAATAVQSGSMRGFGFEPPKGDQHVKGPGAVPVPTASTGTGG